MPIGELFLRVIHRVVVLDHREEKREREGDDRRHQWKQAVAKRFALLVLVRVGIDDGDAVREAVELVNEFGELRGRGDFHGHGDALRAALDLHVGQVAERAVRAGQGRGRARRSRQGMVADQFARIDDQLLLGRVEEVLAVVRHVVGDENDRGSVRVEGVVRRLAAVDITADGRRKAREEKTLGERVRTAIATENAHDGQGIASELLLFAVVGIVVDGEKRFLSLREVGGRRVERNLIVGICSERMGWARLLGRRDELLPDENSFSSLTTSMSLVMINGWFDGLSVTSSDMCVILDDE